MALDSIGYLNTAGQCHLGSFCDIVRSTSDSIVCNNTLNIMIKRPMTSSFFAFLNGFLVTDIVEGRLYWYRKTASHDHATHKSVV